jgi:hypothetical protein
LSQANQSKGVKQGVFNERKWASKRGILSKKGSEIIGQTKRDHRANEIYPVKKPTLKESLVSPPILVLRPVKLSLAATGEVSFDGSSPRKV